MPFNTYCLLAPRNAIILASLSYGTYVGILVRRSKLLEQTDLPNCLTLVRPAMLICSHIHDASLLLFHGHLLL